MGPLLDGEAQVTLGEPRGHNTREHDMTSPNPNDRIAALEQRVALMEEQIHHITRHATELDRLRQEIANLKVEIEERTEFG